MTLEQVSSSCHQPTKDVVQANFLFKSFFKNALQKSLTFAEKLFSLPMISTKSSINLQTQALQRTKPTQQFLNDIKKKREIIQSAQEFLNSSDFLSQKNKQIQGLKPSKSRSQMVKIILLIQSQKGRFNVNEVFKKLKSSKEQKIHKQKLKISRSQFTHFHSQQLDAEFQGKTLKQIFQPESEESESKQKDLRKVQQDVKQNEKCQQKTPIKGLITSSQQKMINEDSPLQTVFRGDLSTILQSSNQDISKEKQIDKGFIFADKLKIELNSQCLQGVRQSREVAKKINPFLNSMKNNNNLSNQQGNGEVIEAMRKSLFNATFGPSGDQMIKVEQKKIQFMCNITNSSLYHNQGTGRLTNNIQSNVVLNISNSQQSETIAKQILNTFIQPDKCINPSLFDQKGEKQSQNKKTERKMKKRGKKEERIRG